MEVPSIVQDVSIRTIPVKKKRERAEWWSGEAGRIAEQRREVEARVRGDTPG